MIVKRLKGIFITLEGNEGCGKSTQIKQLEAFLKERGFRVHSTREPGGTEIGNDIRRVLLDPANKDMSPICEVFLYMASRAQLVRDVILPKLEEGYVVLCDRWLDATIAYQGAAGGVDVKWIKALGEKTTGALKPDISLYLDLDIKVGLERATSHKKADRMEKKDLAFHEKVRQGFLRIAKEEPRRFKRLAIKASDSEAAVHEMIKGALRDVIRGT